MSSQYRNLTYASEPEFTETIASGYAVSQLTEEEVVGYLDRVWRSCEKSFPPGLTYDGCRRMRPQEVYKYFSSKKLDKNKRWDFARTDVYLMEYALSYKGQKLGPFQIFLPFTDDVAMTYINGKPFYNKPVVRDSVLQVTNNQIFLQFLSTPCTFSRLYYMVLRNGEWQSISIYHGCFHHVLRQVQRKKVKASAARIALNSHYLFIKFGFEESFKRFTNTEIKFGTRDELDEMGVNEADYYIYASKAGTPYWVAKNESYTPHDMRIAVKKEDWTQVVESMIVSAIYVFDLFPEEVNSNDIKNVHWWSMMLGRIIFGEGQLPSILIGKVSEHIKGADNYVDNLSVENFEQNGIHVENMYDFLFYLIENFDNIVYNRSSSPSSLVGRQLTVKQYILSEIIAKIFLAGFKIAEIKPEKLNHTRIEELLVKLLRPKLIFTNNQGKPFCVSVSTPCDVRVFGVTSEVLPQDNVTGKVKQKDKSVLHNPRWQLDSSFMTIGGAFAQSKNEPIGVDKINPYANVNTLGVLDHQDVLRPIAKRIDKVLQNS